MPVAKSYSTLNIEEGPYEVNKRMYCKVRMKNGSLKQVRWYTDKEYARMYPDAIDPAPSTTTFKPQKELLGFDNGYITIFKGDTYTHKEWFQRSIARYCRWWGWYIVSTDIVPNPLPTGITAVQLPWELVGNSDGNLKPESVVIQAVEPLLYDASPSVFQGTIGERLDRIVTVMRAIELDGNFGSSIMHIMEDEAQNVYVWTTSARSWSEGAVKHIRGTVKEHKIYKNVQQTILTRTMEV